MTLRPPPHPITSPPPPPRPPHVDPHLPGNAGPGGGRAPAVAAALEADAAGPQAAGGRGPDRRRAADSRVVEEGPDRVHETNDRAGREARDEQDQGAGGRGEGPEAAGYPATEPA